MFNKETVFVLGAGASWHYSYPTGEALIRKCIDKAQDCAQVCTSLRAAAIAVFPNYIKDKNDTSSPSAKSVRGIWEKTAKEFLDLAERLKHINPLVIDYFLAENDTLQNIGRLVIAWVILECEEEFNEYRCNRNRIDKDEKPIIKDTGHDDWIRFILYTIVRDCKSIECLISNKINFITFNYDTSLEDQLYKRLNAIDLFRANEEKIKDFLQERIVHVYGRIHENFWDAGYLNIRGGLPESFIIGCDKAYIASKLIRTIDPSDKSENEVEIKKAQTLIKDAECVYILGYGFDKRNSEILDLKSCKAKSSREINKEVYFTNFDDRNGVNKRAGEIFVRSKKYFLPPSSIWDEHSNSHYEKSTRDVYGALERDFDI